MVPVTHDDLGTPHVPPVAGHDKRSAIAIDGETGRFQPQSPSVITIPLPPTQPTLAIDSHEIRQSVSVEITDTGTAPPTGRDLPALLAHKTQRTARCQPRAGPGADILEVVVGVGHGSTNEVEISIEIPVGNRRIRISPELLNGPLQTLLADKTDHLVIGLQPHRWGPSADSTCRVQIAEKPDPSILAANDQVDLAVAIPVGSVGHGKIVQTQFGTAKRDRPQWAKGKWLVLVQLDRLAGQRPTHSQVHQPLVVAKREERSAGIRQFLATGKRQRVTAIQPWHGLRLALFSEDDNPFQRPHQQVLPRIAVDVHHDRFGVVKERDRPPPGTGCQQRPVRKPGLLVVADIAVPPDGGRQVARQPGAILPSLAKADPHHGKIAIHSHRTCSGQQVGTTVAVEVGEPATRVFLAFFRHRQISVERRLQKSPPLKTPQPLGGRVLVPLKSLRRTDDGIEKPVTVQVPDHRATGFTVPLFVNPSLTGTLEQRHPFVLAAGVPPPLRRLGPPVIPTDQVHPSVAIPVDGHRRAHHGCDRRRIAVDEPNRPGELVWLFCGNSSRTCGQGNQKQSLRMGTPHVRSPPNTSDSRTHHRLTGPVLRPSGRCPSGRPASCQTTAIRTGKSCTSLPTIPPV